MKRVVFSEKGYQMISCAKKDNAVLLWDLRKLTTQLPLSIQSEENAK